MEHGNLFELLKRQIEGADLSAEGEEVGRVLSVADGVAQIEGLRDVMSSEMVMIQRWPQEEGQDPVPAIALNLEEYLVGAVILGEESRVREGDVVRRTQKVLSIPAGEELLGRVVNPLGVPMDGKPAPRTAALQPLEAPAPAVLDRESVNAPLATGIKVIDAAIPIGRGQRELIIGDRQTGKSALAEDIILHQKNEPEENRPVCIYVAIGQKYSKVAQLVKELEDRGAMAYTIVVVAGASDPASLWYAAPYAGCALGEYFRDKGKDAVVIYDDLTKHAWAWRQISLLLRRPPGREAYPGDVFYLHSRLLERSAKLSKEKGGGSLTALPIIETQMGDVSAYVPTNVISITDGQIYTETSLFLRGQRPAVNIGLSVSRVGSAAQTKAMKKVASQLKLELAQYQELAAFTQFSQDLDAATRKRLDRGSRLMEILKQDQFATLPAEEQVMVLFAGIEGYLDRVPVEDIRATEHALLEHLRMVHASLLERIRKSGTFDEEAKEQAAGAIDSFIASRHGVLETAEN